MNFMDENFLLRTKAAQKLFHEYAENMPIIDYHCHLSPAEIAQDRKYANISEVWLGGDHYKWRAMRSDGVPEHFITGSASDYEKFEKWAGVVPKLIGNPLYHWTHLELQRYFGIYEPLSPATCSAIWDKCNDKLETLSARQCIKAMNVRAIYTTDDPCDDLRYHKKLISAEGLGFRVFPAWRPDNIINIDKPGFRKYIEKLSAAAGMSINSLDDVKAALSGRMDFFHGLGCRNSDHGLDYIPFENTAAAPDAFLKAINAEPLTRAETDSFKTALLLFLAGEYSRRGWVMQLHYGAVRNVNHNMYSRLGSDTGFDAIRGSADSGIALSGLLGAMEKENLLPRTIIYSLNPADNALIGSVIGCFQNTSARCRVQQGCAWWFNDSLKGMREQLTSLASLSVLADFVGMVTDSRSFLSYTRHEYFRRVLCDLIGSWVDAGEYPEDYENLGKAVRDICYNNAVEFFSL